MTGYHVGAVLTALLALVLIERLGAGSRCSSSAVSPGWLTVPADVGQAAGVRRPTSAPSAPSTGRPRNVPQHATWSRAATCAVSLGLWVASFMGLLLVYGLNTWLPTIMGEAGYSIRPGPACCSC